MRRLTENVCLIDYNINTMCKCGGRLDVIEAKFADMRDAFEMHSDSFTDCIKQVFDSEDGCGKIDLIYDRVGTLVNDLHRRHAVVIAQHTLDKFNDYMKNFDKMNSMVNEFKGCVSIARASLEEKKVLENLRRDTKSKLNGIYHVVCEYGDKKPSKTTKKSKKKSSSDPVAVVKI